MHARHARPSLYPRVDVEGNRRMDVHRGSDASWVANGPDVSRSWDVHRINRAALLRARQEVEGVVMMDGLASLLTPTAEAAALHAHALAC